MNGHLVSCSRVGRQLMVGMLGVGLDYPPKDATLLAFLTVGRPFRTEVRRDANHHRCNDAVPTNPPLHNILLVIVVARGSSCIGDLLDSAVNTPDRVRFRFVGGDEGPGLR